MNAIVPGLVALGLLAATPPAAALSLGEISLQSRLGEPVKAEIPLIIEDGSLPAAACFSLAGSQQSDLPAITQGRLRIIQRGASSRLQIVGRSPVNEPVFVISIKAGCGHELQREYVLMPDAPLSTELSAKELPLASRSDDAADAPLPPTRRARKTLPPPADGESEMPPPRRKARSMQSASLTPSDRLILGAPEAGASTATSEALRDLNDRLLRMETTLHTLNEEISKLDVALAAAAQKTEAEGRLRTSTALQTSPATVAAPPPPEAPSRPQATPWLELLLTTFLGGALTFGAAFGISRWRESRLEDDLR